VLVLKNKSGQAFVSLVAMAMGIMIFLFATPVLFEIIQEQVPQMGTATAFIVKLFLWLIMIVLIAVFIKIINSDQGFFTR